MRRCAPAASESAACGDSTGSCAGRSRGAHVGRLRVGQGRRRVRSVRWENCPHVPRLLRKLPAVAAGQEHTGLPWLALDRALRARALVRGHSCNGARVCALSCWAALQWRPRVCSLPSLQWKFYLERALADLGLLSRTLPRLRMAYGSRGLAGSCSFVTALVCAAATYSPRASRGAGVNGLCVWPRAPMCLRAVC